MVLFCVGFSPAAEPEKLVPSFRSEANEIALTFSATDQNDHGVATLQADDVVVIDRDIVVRQFQRFSRSNWTRLQIAILADSSESVRPQFRQELARVVELVSQTEGIPEQSVSVFGFRDSQPRLICAEDCRTSLADAQIPESQAGRLTPLFDSIVFAADFLAQHDDAAGTEKVLIIFSDGVDTVSRHPLADALETALRAGITIDAVDLGRNVEGTIVLNRLSAATGGRYFPAGTDAGHVLAAVFDNFHASYEIQYRLPSHISGFHSVRILATHNRNLQFRSRSGYYYPNEMQ